MKSDWKVGDEVLIVGAICLGVALVLECLFPMSEEELAREEKERYGSRPYPSPPQEPRF